jgi:hypothetical protein
MRCLRCGNKLNILESNYCDECRCKKGKQSDQKLWDEFVKHCHDNGITYGCALRHMENETNKLKRLMTSISCELQAIAGKLYCEPPEHKPVRCCAGHDCMRKGTDVEHILNGKYYCKVCYDLMVSG